MLLQYLIFSINTHCTQQALINPTVSTPLFNLITSSLSNRNKMSKSTAKDHARTIWCMRLESSLRSAFACSIVGVATLYGPTFLLNQLQFPGLSYVVIILILFTSTTLGHALSGCWHALYATIQVVPLSMLSRWLVSPRGKGELSVGVAALAAAAASFLVALPESTHVTTKRIALGLIALICTEVVVNSAGTRHGFMNPLHIGASAMLGALASLLALLLPFPRLAHHRINKLCQVYAENASKRIDIYLRALNAHDHQTKTELVLQAKPIAEIGTKLLQSIKILQEGLPWERPWSPCSANNPAIEVENRLQSFEIPIKSIEYCLAQSSHEASPLQISDQEQLSALLSTQLHKRIHKIRDNEDRELVEIFSDLPIIHPVKNHGPACFIFSCIFMLLNARKQSVHDPKTGAGITRFIKPEPALKFSITLGLAVLLGVVLERENARWAGLTVAITFSAAGHQPIFTTANTRAQGTAVGTVYGVVCCFLSHHPEMRLLALVPWIVLAAFLKHSRLYGPTGGVSAAIGASVILGRKNYGPPNEFAIGRMTSVFIGLFCFVLIGLVFQPTRAATLAQMHLSETLLSLVEFLKQTRFYHSERENELFPKFRELGERQRALKAVVADAKSEPGFWYLPFHGCCYKKAAGCLYNVVSLLYILMHNLEVLSGLQLYRAKEFEEQLNYELGVLQRTVGSSLEKLSQIKASQVDPRDDFDDVEGGKSCESLESLGSSIIEEVVRNGGDNEKQVQVKVRCLGAIGFCIGSLRNEIDQIEICVKEIVRWGNHPNQ